MAYKYLNLDYLNLMSGGDKADRRELLEMLSQSLQNHPSQMQRTLKAGDWDKLEREAHYFKSTLPFTGCEKLIAIHRAAYEKIKDKESRSEVPALLRQVRALSGHVLIEVQEELGKG